MAQLVKNLPAMRETWVLSLGWEDPLENGKATHSSTLACRIPRQSMGSQSPIGLSDFHFHFTIERTSLVAQLVKSPPAMQDPRVPSLGWEDPLEKGKATHSSILAWPLEFQGLYSPWDCRAGHN